MTHPCTETQRTIARHLIMGRLLRSLIHELSNPLQAVSGAVSLAQEDLTTPSDLPADLEIIQSETRRMETLLQTARLLYRGRQIAPLAALLEDTLLLARKEWQWNRLTWELQTDLPKNGAVACPEMRLALLGVLQLVAEAAQAHPQTRVQIEMQVGAGQARLHFRCSPPLSAAQVTEAYFSAVRCLLASCQAQLHWQPDDIALHFPILPRLP